MTSPQRARGRPHVSQASSPRAPFYGPLLRFAERWLRRPQNVWLRKALFQIHLWTGIGLGLYVLMISVTGSAIVFRNELYTILAPGPTAVPITGEPLTQEQMRLAAKRAFPDYAVTFIFPARKPGIASEVWLERHGWKRERQFNPYTGEDLGPARPYSFQLVAWLNDFHLNLLAGTKGRVVNGIAAAFFSIVAMTGAIVWWPGIANWRRSLAINTKANWKRFNWDLHSAVGIWSLAFVFMWGITGVYVVFPEPFQRAINKVAPLDFYRLDPFASLDQSSPAKLAPLAQEKSDVSPERPRRRRPPPHLSAGDRVLRGLYAAHFGNFGGWFIKTLWVILGLAPVLLFVTGVLMWWNRVLSPSARRARRQTPEAHMLV